MRPNYFYRKQIALMWWQMIIYNRSRTLYNLQYHDIFPAFNMLLKIAVNVRYVTVTIYFTAMRDDRRNIFKMLIIDWTRIRGGSEPGVRRRRSTGPVGVGPKTQQPIKSPSMRRLGEGGPAYGSGMGIPSDVAVSNLTVTRPWKKELTYLC